MPTTRVRKPLAAFWSWFAYDHNDDPGAFQVGAARSIDVALDAIAVVTAIALLIVV